MNYRHHFHAGNFADVFKHVWLTRLLVYLAQKDAPFHYLDTHAGIGLYDLAAAPSQRTAEWREGIGRLLTASLSPACRALIAPYLALAGPVRADGSLSAYPGSPAIAQALLRAQDRMTACELHPEDCATLRQNLGRDRRAKAIEIDGYVALNAYIPPRERRGLVLIDPPFEQADEFARLTQALGSAHAKWPGGVYALWYPVKGLQAGEQMAAMAAAAGITRILRIELLRTPIGTGGADERLNGCGLLIVNPPYTFGAQCAVIMPELARILGQNGAGQWRVTE